MHELSLQDNKEAQFSLLLILMLILCKMMAALLFHGKSTLECLAAIINVMYGVDVLKYF